MEEKYLDYDFEEYKSEYDEYIEKVKTIKRKAYNDLEELKLV